MRGNRLLPHKKPCQKSKPLGFSLCFSDCKRYAVNRAPVGSMHQEPNICNTALRTSYFHQQMECPQGEVSFISHWDTLLSCLQGFKVKKTFLKLILSKSLNSILNAYLSKLKSSFSHSSFHSKISIILYPKEIVKQKKQKQNILKREKLKLPALQSTLSTTSTLPKASETAKKIMLD